MIDVGVAIAWIAISAAGMKGLSALTRTVALDNAQVELSACAGEGSPIDVRALRGGGGGGGGRGVPLGHERP